MKSIRNLLAQNKKDYPEIRKTILDLFIKDTGVTIGTTGITAEHEKQLVQWFNKKCSDDPILHSLLFNKKKVLIPGFSVDLSSKINAISQYHCPLCEGGGFPIHILNIRISPVSKQAISKDPTRRSAFERAIKQRLSNKSVSFAKGEKLCVHIIFVLGKRNRDKDLDNMSKAFLDSLNDNLFGDDIDIEHLSLIKFNWLGEEDYITIRVMKSTISQNDDILVSGMYHSWAGQEYIDLDSYI